ncbi:MAG: low-complexity tail membrane protein [Synechococcus sp. MOX_bin73]|nr:low-complexity tail membrane protein [Synechococcus sp. MOX_bin73]
MKSRLEPVLWLQCLALGAIPLELLLIRLVLAGADPGPVPPVERLLVWAIGVLAPAAALWKRPADWGSLLLVRVPLRERDQEQHALSAKQGGLISRTSVAVAALGSLPLLWWLDDSAVLASEFSPVLGQSRLVTLLISIPVLALMVWQVQQLSQALGWLLPIRAEPDQAPTADNSAGQNSAATDQQHTSFGLQILRLNRLAWPEPAAKPTQEPTPKPPPASEAVSQEPVPTENKPLVANAADQGQTNPTDSSNDPEEYTEPSIDESKDLEDEGVENKCLEKNDTETGDVDIDLDTAEEDTSEVDTNEANFEQLKDDQAVNDEAASDEASSDDPITIEETSRADDRMITMDDSSVDARSILETDPPVEAQPDEASVGVSSAIEIKENGEERESASLDPEVTELNSITGGNAGAW